MNLPGTQSREPWKTQARHLLSVLRPGHILALALLLRVALFLSVGSWHPEVAHNVLLKSDAGLYHKLAVHLAETGSFQAEPIRTPGYLCYVAGWYSLFGEQPWVVILSQIFLDVAVCYLCYLLARRMIGREGGLLAAFFYAIDPTSILNVNMLMSDTLFTFFLLAAALAVMRAFQEENRRDAFRFHLWAGGLLGLAALTRPIALYFLPLYLLGMLWFYRKRPAAALGTATAAALLFCALLAPWIYRNHTEFGVAGLSSSGPLNLFYLYAVPTESLRSSISGEEAVESIYHETGFDKRELDPARNNDYVQHQKLSVPAKEYLLAHPDWFVLATLYGMGQMYANTGSGSYSLLLGLETGTTDIKDAAAVHGVIGGVGAMLEEKNPVEMGILGLNSLVHLLQYGFLIVGIVTLGRRLREPKFLALVAFIILYSALIGAAGWMRFKLPIVPFYAVLAGAGCAASVLRGALIRGRRERSVVGSRATPAVGTPWSLERRGVDRR